MATKQKLSINMQKMLFESGLKFNIEKNKDNMPESKEEIDERKAMVLSVDMGLRSLGYCLDGKLMAALATYPKDEQMKLYQDLATVIKYHTGVDLFEGTQTFYPNFPEEVMSKDDVELYLNAVLYYLGENVFGINAHEMLKDMGAIEEKISRLPNAELYKRPAKTIMNASIDDLHELADNMMHGTSLPQGKAEQLWAYMKEYPEKSRELLSNGREFKSKEAVCEIACHIIKGNDKKDMALLRDGKLVDKADDVLRIAAVLSNDYIDKKNKNQYRNLIPRNDANLSVPTKEMVIHLSNDQKKLISDMLDKCPDLYTSIWYKEDKWKKAMPYLGVGHKDKASDRVKGAFDNLHNKQRVNEKGQPIITTGVLYHNALSGVKTGDKDAVMELAKRAPKDFFRNIASLMQNSKNEKTMDAVIKAVPIAAKKTDPAEILKAASYVTGARSWEQSVYKVKSGKLFLDMEKDKAILSNVPFNKIKELAVALIKGTQENMKGVEELGKVYVDPALGDIKIPTRGERTASAGATLTYGSKIPSLEGKNLIAMAIWWKNEKGRSHCDVDLSASFLDENYKEIGHVSYSNLKTTGKDHETNEKLLFAVHSGDFVDGDALHDGKGVEEVVMIDKDRAKRAGVKYVTFVVHGFSVDFNKCENLRCVMMEKEGSFENFDVVDDLITKGQEHPVFCGETIESSQIDNAIRLNAPSNMETPCFFNLESDEYIWLDSTNDVSYGLVNVKNKESERAINFDLWRAEHNAIPTMGQLFACYADANGEITKDIEEADTVFIKGPVDTTELGLKENANVITSLDLEKVSKICTIQPKLNDERVEERVKAKEDDPQSIDDIINEVVNEHQDDEIDSSIIEDEER